MPQRFAAQVVLSASGQHETIRVLRAFQSLGFDTGGVVGGSFSIEAEGARYTEVFGVTLALRADGGVAIDVGGPDADAAQGLLPRRRLPAGLQPMVAAVLFTPPPAFGPTGGFMQG